MLTRADVKLPRTFDIYAGADTGTYMGGVIAAVSPELHLYVLEVVPNYHYTGDGTIELIGMTVGEWFEKMGKALRYWTKQKRNKVWVDANTTFKTEVAHGVRFAMNRKDLELRTEITREYLRHGRVHLMPWVAESVLTYEMEEAHYPEQESASTGRLRRVKTKDHCLDGVEHICSRKPNPKMRETGKKKGKSFEHLIDQNKLNLRYEDPHMGAQ